MVVALVTTDVTRLDDARDLAKSLQIPFLGLETLHYANSDLDFILFLTPDYLGIAPQKKGKVKPFFVDFVQGKISYRAKQAQFQRESLIKALGIAPSLQTHIVDGTAGFGRDGFILASKGFRVTLLERSPIIHALLADGLQRFRQTNQDSAISKRMELHCIDLINWCRNPTRPPPPEIIYLDPMFPTRSNKALVKKEMQILQDLLGYQDDIDELLQVALTCARNRVVVKRPRLAGFTNPKPNFSLTGTTCRFDVYLVPK